MHNTLNPADPSLSECTAPGTTTPRDHAAPSPSRTESRRYALTDKLRIVQEASQAGVKLTHIERKYGLGKNVLAYWRKVYRDLSENQVRAEQQLDPAHEELAALRVQVRQLERLLGQKTLEVELLKRRCEGDA